MSDDIKNTKINYLSYDYDSVRSALIDYAKTYFPNSYTDFTTTSPVGFFTGMVSYVGDLLSFYIDKRFQESIMQTATDRKSIVDLSRFLGYNHKVSSAATVDLSIYQLIPKDQSANKPDYSYSFKVNKGMKVASNTSGQTFITLDDVDFSNTASVEISMYDSQYQNASYFVLKKTVRAISANETSENFIFTSPSSFSKIILNRTDVIGITSVVDSDGNIWYEVPYLSQDTIIEEIENTAKTNSLYSSLNHQAPYLINLKKVTRRFIKRTNSSDKTELIFGSGTENLVNEDIVVTQKALSELFLDSSIADRTIDTRNFLRLDSLGETPTNTTITVTYKYGGGVDANVPSNDIVNISSKTLTFNGTGLDAEKKSFVQNSLAVKNMDPAIGGSGRESDEEIKQNALAYFSAQNRMVTKEDYEIRTLSLDPKFGSIEKAFAIKDVESPTSVDYDNSTISIYCLSTTTNGNLARLNQATQYNLKKYLDQYRMLTDNIIIKNGCIINIGIKIGISAHPSFNEQTVIFQCLTAAKNYFNIDKWQMGQPIILSNLSSILYKLNGVKSINYIKVENKRLGSYSNAYYDIEKATVDQIIYSSIDPAIFEVKFPDIDIEVTAI